MDYAAKARSADRMIRAYGSTATHTAVASVYVPATGSTTDTTTTQTVQAAVFDYAAGMIDGTMIRTGDKQAFLSAVGVTAPRAGDSLTWGGVVHKLVTVKPLAPALVNVLFECQIRA
jgi:hypothetical protein